MKLSNGQSVGEVGPVLTCPVRRTGQRSLTGLSSQQFLRVGQVGLVVSGRQVRDLDRPGKFGKLR